MDIYTHREVIQYIREGFGSIYETLAILEDIEHRLHRIEITMTDLSTAETDLANAVTALAARLQNELGPLQDALTAAQAQVAADDTQIAGLLADAQTAADNIEAQVTALNALDTAPAAPSDGSTPTAS